MSGQPYHDEIVDRLNAVLTSHFRNDPKRVLLTRTYWQPLVDFPNIVHRFDLIVAEGNPVVWFEDGRKICAPDTAVVTVIDVVTSESDLEEAFYDKPDVLTQSGVFEYCLFDPTAEVLRPPLQAYRKQEGAFRVRGSGGAGQFFSACGFRLVARGETIEVHPCGQVWLEEELFECRSFYQKALTRPVRDEKEIAGLDAKIRRLEEQLLVCRGERS